MLNAALFNAQGNDVTQVLLPLKLYRRLPDGSREPATDHPLYRVLCRSPNFEMTRSEHNCCPGYGQWRCAASW